MLDDSLAIDLQGSVQFCVEVALDDRLNCNSCVLYSWFDDSLEINLRG